MRGERRGHGKATAVECQHTTHPRTHTHTRTWPDQSQEMSFENSQPAHHYLSESCRHARTATSKQTLMRSCHSPWLASFFPGFPFANQEWGAIPESKNQSHLSNKAWQKYQSCYRLGTVAGVHQVHKIGPKPRVGHVRGVGCPEPRPTIPSTVNRR
jgi:hypothetical protein